MGNTQGIKLEPLDDGYEAQRARQHGALAITGPPATSEPTTALVANKKGRNGKGGRVAIRKTTDESTTLALQAQSPMILALRSNVRDAEERAIKAEAGQRKESFESKEWQAKYEAAEGKIAKMEEEARAQEKRAKADQKRIEGLEQSVVALQNKLERSERGEGRRGEKRVKKSSSQSSIHSPEMKRRRSNENVAADSTSMESIQSMTAGSPLTVPFAEHTDDIQQGDKLASECERLRATLAQFEDVQPMIMPVTATLTPTRAQLEKKLKSAEETNRELIGYLNFYKEEFEEYKQRVYASLLPPLSPPSTPPRSDPSSNSPHPFCRD